MLHNDLARPELWETDRNAFAEKRSTEAHKVTEIGKVQMSDPMLQAFCACTVTQLKTEPKPQSTRAS